MEVKWQSNVFVYIMGLNVVNRDVQDILEMLLKCKYLKLYKKLTEEIAKL